MNLTNFSVKNYQFTLVMFIMAVVVGAVTLFTMPRAEDPQINPPQFPIVVVYPGTNPLDMEELVVEPIENKLYELENIDKIITTIEDGIAVLRVEFLYGVDIDNKYQEVVREVNSLDSQLPEGIVSVDVRKVDPSDVNVFQLAFISENAAYSEMKEYADDLKEELEKLVDLKQVEISGAPEKIVRIDLQFDKIAELGIPLNAVIGSIRSESLNIPGGSITADNRTYSVKTSGKFENVEQIASTVVYSGGGKIVYLKDVADIQFRNEADKHITRVNGHRSVLLNAAQKVGSNISTTQANYQPVLNKFQEKLPANIKMVKYFDQADNVQMRLSGLGVDFMIAIFLVLFTLLPLGFRASFVVMLAIPVSLALGIVGLNAFGISINQLSIVGLVLALG
ncbi:MAG: efflux RND transporter permease subunit, partial [Flavobacteriales bacterium]|nr:efflux RND transporter permease subunit [Flavobacteriales bacterium]